MSDRTGNMPVLPGIYPDYRAPIVRNQPDGRELTMARWGMPSPPFALKGKKSDPASPMSATSARLIGEDGLSREPVPVLFTSLPRTNICRTAVARRCGLHSTKRPLAFFAGIWTRWTSVQGEEGEHERPSRSDHRCQ
jgi:putative SOS response-associated peptidase YedK